MLGAPPIHVLVLIHLHASYCVNHCGIDDGEACFLFLLTLVQLLTTRCLFFLSLLAIQKEDNGIERQKEWVEEEKEERKRMTSSEMFNQHQAEKWDEEEDEPEVKDDEHDTTPVEWVYAKGLAGWTKKNVKKITFLFSGS